jgi:hypothetical protein
MGLAWAAALRTEAFLLLFEQVITFQKFIHSVVDDG